MHERRHDALLRFGKCRDLLQITSKQLRDDLMTMLIAGHETTAAVLTWTLHCLADRPDVLKRLQQEVRTPASPTFPSTFLSSICQGPPFLRAILPDLWEPSRGSSLGATDKCWLLDMPGTSRRAIGGWQCTKQ